MSILPLTIGARLTISMNSIPLDVVDVTYATVSGVDRQNSAETRNIRAAVDLGGKRTLSHVFGQTVSDGDIGVWPQDGAELYFLDEFVPGEMRKQSFVTFRSFQYRVIGVADNTDQCGSKAFLATRHVSQDLA